ncbi:hypothetical protein F2Q68_00044475 [Brassica cretica]|uniref:Uncharacterized protein n=1 Tax=Brassica cretica TaxID=69181 RepID=A0A8S9LKQ5_BRACR|nr:hypothetical protein F2Q68_00044475 [Brassica cretica]
MTLIALPVSTRILEKMVPASSSVMTRASSWGISSLTFSCSWKVILMSSCVIPSGMFCPIAVRTAPLGGAGFPDLEVETDRFDAVRSSMVWIHNCA